MSIWATIGLGAALALSLLGNLYQFRAAGVASANCTAAQMKLADANDSNSTVITGLQGSVAECEAGRIADEKKAVQAMTLRDFERAAADRRAIDARAELARLKSGRCKAWADQPACGVSP